MMFCIARFSAPPQIPAGSGQGFPGRGTTQKPYPLSTCSSCAPAAPLHLGAVSSGGAHYFVVKLPAGACDYWTCGIGAGRGRQGRDLYLGIRTASGPFIPAAPAASMSSSQYW